ncbi:50S ribosomal protein L9 [Patescibacteria group bacterium]|nr:50S ribosomal protein L9 [Patescibacteria group bacterium]
MRIILLQDIKKIGKKYEIKEVKSGFARNYLIPQKLAKIADEKTIIWAKEQQEKEIKKAEKKFEKITDLISRIDGLEVEFKMKTGENNQIFEKITEQKISKRLKEMKCDIGTAKIELEKPLAEMGEFPVKIKFPHNLEAEIKIIITEEK